MLGKPLSIGTGTVPADSVFTYATNGNLLTKPGASLSYGGARPHAVTSATLKGVSHSYGYDAAGYMIQDMVGATVRRTLGWTSYGQLRQLDYQGAPALQNFAGGLIYAASDVQTDFGFDSSGSRARQMKTRIAMDDSRLAEETLYLGSYERETHLSKTSASATPDLVKTVHRHSIGGFAVYTRTEDPGLGTRVDLSLILKDHLGSTDVILTGKWNGSSFTDIQTERQSFDAWGERRNAETFVPYRTADTDAYRTSAQDYDRGYTGHEQLDDSGLIHMNGRLYDPELGRMLSPDPYVQVPEYSQNFNRYSYVLNNPLNLTDPTGYSWLGNAFHQIGSWVHENWRTVVSIIVAVVLWYAAPYIVGANLAVQGAFVGVYSGGFNAAINGGGPGDIMKGAAVGGAQGAIAGGVLHEMEVGAEQWYEKAAHIAGHGVLGGAANEAMGGKFQDGFLSAAAGAYAEWTILKNTTIAGTVGSNVGGRIAIAGIVGGTASVVGGGKFANGAWTAAFQHLVNAELPRIGGKAMEELIRYNARNPNQKGADLIVNSASGEGFNISGAISEIEADPRYTIAGHGTGEYGKTMSAFFDASNPLRPLLRATEYVITASNMAAAVKNDPAWKNREIRLCACNTGRDISGGFAQLLANELGVNVSAPTAILSYSNQKGWFLRANLGQDSGVEWRYFRPIKY